MQLIAAIEDNADNTDVVTVKVNRLGFNSGMILKTILLPQVVGTVV